MEAQSIMTPILASATKMLVSRILKLVRSDGTLFADVRLTKKRESRDSMDSQHRMYEDICRLFMNLLRRKSADAEF